MKVTLTDEQWQKILPFLRTCPNIYIGQEKECRQFLEAVLWIARSGAQWRLLPDNYGNWNTIYKRFARWSQLRWSNYWFFRTFGATFEKRTQKYCEIS